MIRIYTNIVTRRNYNENGDLFRDGHPHIFMNATDTVLWQLCTNTPDIADESGETPESLWTKCTEYGNYSAIGAYLTADNDYIKRIRGTLSANVSSGTVSSISANVPDASLGTIPQSGSITLFDQAGGMEILSYASVTISGESCTFTMQSGTSVSKAYASGGTMDVAQACLMQATLDATLSDVANGLFAFQITAASRKLHDLMAYADMKEADIMGIELAIFNIDSENSTVVDLERYELDSFTIRSGIADTQTNAQVTEPMQNEAVTIMSTLLAAGFELQFSQDGSTDWHSTQSYDAEAMDKFYRFRLASVGGAWSAPVQMVAAEIMEYIAQATELHDALEAYDGDQTEY